MNENAPRWDKNTRTINGKDKNNERNDMLPNNDSFPDKKKAGVLYERITNHIKEAQSIRGEMDVQTRKSNMDYRTEQKKRSNTACIHD